MTDKQSTISAVSEDIDDTKKNLAAEQHTGLEIPRLFTKQGEDVFSTIKYVKRSSVIRNPDGSIVFERHDIEVPEQWSQVATDILAQKYFRRAGVPQVKPTGQPLLDETGKQVIGSEHALRQVVHRLAGCWRFWGESHGYFASKEDAQTFYDEIAYMLLSQMAAPNSPQWFNTGLHFAYGITGPSQGHWYVDPKTDELARSTSAYERPQPHACFIQSVKDDLVNPGGIFDLLLREARIFKYGSGTGTNFSPVRGKGEPLSGGGTSSGLISFLRVNDMAAGSIKSGGTTRRAAKMVCLDVDHPEIEDFVLWKVKEEHKVAALISGSRLNHDRLNAIIHAVVESKSSDPKQNPELAEAIASAISSNIPARYVLRALQLAEQGATSMDLKIFDTDYNGEAYSTVSGQNANNSIQITNRFFTAVERDEDWNLIKRTDGGIFKTIKARKLWDDIGYAAWCCADPGIQCADTINEWHTCPENGRINASNPCSEYLFLDNTACNLASLNLVKFYDEETGTFNIEAYRHAIRLWIIVLEISVLMAQFPGRRMARLSFDFRTLGLGYANIGSLLMIQGIPYDSDEGRALCGVLTSILCGEAYTVSAELAEHLGPFKEYGKNKEPMLRVIRNHRRAAYNTDTEEYKGLTIMPKGLNSEHCPAELLQAARSSWDRALSLGEQHGYRNAQTTVLAPTGTIALVMDCDTTGIEPDFALVKFKKLAGGGYFKIVNQSVPNALAKLGYNEEQIRDIENYCRGHGTLHGAPHVNLASLHSKGIPEEILKSVEKELPNAFEMRFALNKHSLGEELLTTLGATEEQLADPEFDVLRFFGFSTNEINDANEYICGTMMLEGAPHLKEEHLPVFDCASKCGRKGERFISTMGHIRMMAAAQPFISGAISKTINMPEESTVADIQNAYRDAWGHMLKGIALYRDNSKLAQPLSATATEDLFEVAIEEDINEGVGPKEVQAAALKRVLPKRQRLPKKRSGFVQEATVGGHKIYLRTGEYPDGTLGEIFIDMYKEGASYRSLISCFAIAISKALQYGVPLSEFVDSFVFTRFEPSGMVHGHPHVKNATSVLDYVFRVIGYEYLGRTEFLHVKPEDGSVQTTLKKKELPASTEGETGLGPKSGINGSPEKRLDRIQEARVKGYAGEPCQVCGSLCVRRNGACLVCEDCGNTSGCS